MKDLEVRSKDWITTLAERKIKAEKEKERMRRDRTETSTVGGKRSPDFTCAKVSYEEGNEAVKAGN